MKKTILLFASVFALALSACADADPSLDFPSVTASELSSDELHSAITIDITEPEPETSAVTEEPDPTPEFVIIDAPFIYQVDDYPNGCESVTAVMALRYLGFDIDVDTFIDEYLPCGPRPVVGGIGPDPSQVYCGDPRSKSGWGCYSSVIATALNEVTPPPKQMF